MDKIIDYNIEALKSKLNKAIDDENIDEADLLANEISELMQIEINTEMADGFIEKIKKRLRKERSNKFKHIMNVAGIILIVAVALTATANAATGGKILNIITTTDSDISKPYKTMTITDIDGKEKVVSVTVNGKSVDPTKYFRQVDRFHFEGFAPEGEIHDFWTQEGTPKAICIMAIDYLKVDAIKGTGPKVTVSKKGRVYIGNIEGKKRDITVDIQEFGTYSYFYFDDGILYEFQVTGTVKNIKTHSAMVRIVSY